MYIEDNLDWIWQTYKNVRAGDLVIRSGFGLCGVYDFYQFRPRAKKPDYRRPESDTEHAAGCIEIARGLMRAFPQIFTTEEWLRIFDLLKYHDLGEIIYGDHPDDGTQNVNEKNSVELKAFKKAIAYLPDDDAKTLLKDFKSFQKLDLGPKRRNPIYNLVSFCKLCDKLDAVLHAILYELNSVGGDLAFKEQLCGSLSDRDAYYIILTGTTKIAPNWALHFIDACHFYPHFAMFFRILEAAVREVEGGKFYDWLEKAKITLGIPDEHLYHCHI